MEKSVVNTDASSASRNVLHPPYIATPLPVSLPLNTANGVSSVNDILAMNLNQQILSQSNIPSTVKTSHNTGPPNADMVIDLTVASPEPVQKSQAVTNSKETRLEKSSYEIAAEALCLMKFGAPKTEGNKQPQPPHQNVSTVRKVLPKSSIESSKQGTKLPVKSTTTSPPVTQAETVTQSVQKPVRYVLVPESALLSTVNPEQMLSVGGSPIYIMMPKSNLSTSGSVNTQKDITSQPEIPAKDTQTVPSVAFRSSCEATSSKMPVKEMVVKVGDGGEISGIDVNSHVIKVKASSSKRSAPKKHDALKFPPCVICGGDASGMHYGCNTCEACKNFYRRCLLRKSTTPFKCHRSNNCDISYKLNKNNCSACRLAKCLNLGMAKEKCKMGRYTALMRTETIMKVRQLEGKDETSMSYENSPISFENSPLSFENSPILTGSSSQEGEHQDAHMGNPLQFLGITENYGEIISQQIHSNQDDVNGENDASVEFNTELIKTLIVAMENIKPYGEHLVTEEARKACVQKHYEKYMAKVKMFGPLSAVSKEEYQTLLRKYGIDIDGQWEMFKKSSEEADDIVEQYCAFAKHIPNFKKLSCDDQARLLKVTHCDFFLILMKDSYYPEYGIFLEFGGQVYHVEEAADKFFTREIIVALLDMTLRLQRFNLSKRETALLVSIATMASDQCKLDNPKIAEDTHLHLTNLLMEELVRNYGPVAGRKRFTSLIDTLVKMREISNIYYKEYKALCEDDLIKENVPNFDIVLPEDC